jgi:flagellar biogenesis protein FliO
MRAIAVLLAAVILIFPGRSFGEEVGSIEVKLPPPKIVPELEPSTSKDLGGDELRRSRPLDLRDYDGVVGDRIQYKGTGWVGSLLGFLFVLGLIYITFAILRFIRAKGIDSSGRAIRVIESVQVAPGRTICVVEIGERIFAVAFAQGGVGTIAEIADPEEAKRIKAEALRREGVGGAFSEYLASFQRRLTSIRRGMTRW